MRRIARTVMVVLGVIVMVDVGATALMVWAWRSRNPAALRVVKRFNKYVTNRVMLRFSGRSGMSATIHHVGRRTGTPFATPVIAHQSNQNVFIPLPYGTDVDWLRNLMAAGRAVVDLEGRSLEVDEPAVVTIDYTIGFLPAAMVRTVRFNGAREAVRLHVAAPATLASA